MTKPARYMITAALPYANGPLHVGHIAGAYLPADIYVRYLRLKGEDVAFICGSDEHGAAITIRAKMEGISPREIIDKYHERNKEAFAGLGINFDEYHRTSAELHHETAQEFFLDLYNKGVFEEKETEQYFDEEYQQFLADRYIIGTCPNCGNENAYGDQCEKCGSSLSPTDLKNPRSILSDKAPVMKTTKHWYLPLNKYESWLRDWIVDGKDRPEEWKNNVAGQCRSWIDGGLQPRSITRDLDWGVPVPLPDTDGKVLYVWLDAPIGYISATKQWAEDTGHDWKPYWQSPDTKLVHFIGKDNIVFHCIIFPVILKASDKYILPTNVPANEFMNLEGQKISTSRNWAVWVEDYLKDFPAQQDVLRYYLCSNAPETKDSEFTWADFQAKNNNELVATLGNFVNRVLVLTQKYYDGVVPNYNSYFKINGVTAVSEPTDMEMVFDFDFRTLISNYNSFIEKYKFRDALATVMSVASYGNTLLQVNEPWKIKDPTDPRLANIMFINIQIVKLIGILLYPFLPYTSEKIFKMLNQDEIQSPEFRAFLNLESGNKIYSELITEFGVKPGGLIAKPELLFSKIEDDTVLEQVKKLQDSHKTPDAVTASEAPQYEPVKEEIQFEDFMKLDIRIGTIVKAEPVPKADKLLQLEVDLGFEMRTIVSGIAEHYKPEAVVGKQVSVIVNLAPRKLRGVMSQGMILMAEDHNGKLSFVSPQDNIGNGNTVR